MPAVEGVVNTGYQKEILNINKAKDSDGNYIMTRCSTSHIQSDSHATVDMDTSQEQELQHASNMTLSHSMSASSLSNKSVASSALKVEIADIDGEDSINLTTTTLRKCKRQVLRPYWRLLMFIGWRGFGREYVNSGSLGWKFLNTVYPIIIILMLFYTYGYEIMACQWKLNVEKDTQKVVTTTIKPTTPHVNLTTPGFFPIFSISPAEVETASKNLTGAKETYPLGCDHIVTTYVVPNFLHFVAFVMGFIHFRVQENEQLYALMENVFLQASPFQSRSASQRKMIRNMRGFFSVWCCLDFGDSRNARPV